MTTKHEVVNQSLHAIPAGVAVIATMFLKLTLSDWVALFSIGFILLQAAYLIWKWRKESKKRE